MGLERSIVVVPLGVYSTLYPIPLELQCDEVMICYNKFNLIIRFESRS